MGDAAGGGRGWRGGWSACRAIEGNEARGERRGGYIYGVPILAPKSIAAWAYFLILFCARFESSGEEMGVGRNTML